MSSSWGAAVVHLKMADNIEHAVGAADSFSICDANVIENNELIENKCESKCLALITDKRNCRQLRLALERLNLFDPTRPVQQVGSDQVALAIHWDPLAVFSIQEWLVQESVPSEWTAILEKLQPEVRLLNFPDKRTRATQREKLKQALKRLVTGDKRLEWSQEFENCIPSSWEKHGDMVILPNDSFLNKLWTDISGHDLWTVITEALSCHRLARRKKIKNDHFRTPQVELLLGDNGWVYHVDNGIRYTFDVTKSMFSAGNITEKLRIAAMDCTNQIIVDMFAGIGYFTLPYLVHAKASLVHACEWNPDAIAALRQNLELNGVKDRCIVHEGDNRTVAPIGVAHHVNLGLIPSSRDSWETACRALHPTAGGILHVHGNVESFPRPGDCPQNGDQSLGLKTPKPNWKQWAVDVCREIGEILDRIAPETGWTVRVDHIEHVKRYAPHIDHLVVDLRCVPRQIERPHT